MEYGKWNIRDSLNLHHGQDEFLIKPKARDSRRQSGGRKIMRNLPGSYLQITRINSRHRGGLDSTRLDSTLS